VKERFRVVLTGTRSTWSSRGSPPTSRDRESDRELISSSDGNAQIKGSKRAKKGCR
jgi:hypothetical protein